ncbi:hypothetical protein HK101_003018 [Irineochytrium annulatum]|nr:hypothetical protein HK101_003018 [Irineochytrium annulatum]
MIAARPTDPHSTLAVSSAGDAIAKEDSLAAHLGNGSSALLGDSMRGMNSLELSLLMLSRSGPNSNYNPVSSIPLRAQVLHAIQQAPFSALRHTWGDDNTVLHLAARLGDRAILKALLERGADQERRNGKGLSAVDVLRGGMRLEECFDRREGRRGLPTRRRAIGDGVVMREGVNGRVGGGGGGPEDGVMGSVTETGQDGDMWDGRDAALNDAVVEVHERWPTAAYDEPVKSVEERYRSVSERFPVIDAKYTREMDVEAGMMTNSTSLATLTNSTSLATLSGEYGDGPLAMSKLDATCESGRPDEMMSEQDALMESKKFANDHEPMHTVTERDVAVAIANAQPDPVRSPEHRLNEVSPRSKTSSESASKAPTVTFGERTRNASATKQTPRNHALEDAQAPIAETRADTVTTFELQLTPVSAPSNIPSEGVPEAHPPTLLSERSRSTSEERSRHAFATKGSHRNRAVEEAHAATTTESPRNRSLVEETHISVRTNPFMLADQKKTSAVNPSTCYLGGRYSRPAQVGKLDIAMYESNQGRPQRTALAENESERSHPSSMADVESNAKAEVVNVNSMIAPAPLTLVEDVPAWSESPISPREAKDTTEMTEATVPNTILPDELSSGMSEFYADPPTSPKPIQISASMHEKSYAPPPVSQSIEISTAYPRRTSLYTLEEEDEPLGPDNVSIKESPPATPRHSDLFEMSFALEDEVKRELEADELSSIASAGVSVGWEYQSKGMEESAGSFVRDDILPHLVTTQRQLPAMPSSVEVLFEGDAAVLPDIDTDVSLRINTADILKEGVHDDPSRSSAYDMGPADKLLPLYTSDSSPLSALIYQDNFLCGEESLSFNYASIIDHGSLEDDVEEDVQEEPFDADLFYNFVVAESFMNQKYGARSVPDSVLGAGFKPTTVNRMKVLPELPRDVRANDVMGGSICHRDVLTDGGQIKEASTRDNNETSDPGYEHPTQMAFEHMVAEEEDDNKLLESVLQSYNVNAEEAADEASVQGVTCMREADRGIDDNAREMVEVESTSGLMSGQMMKAEAVEDVITSDAQPKNKDSAVELPSDPEDIAFADFDAGSNAPAGAVMNDVSNAAGTQARLPRRRSAMMSMLRNSVWSSNGESHNGTARWFSFRRKPAAQTESLDRKNNKSKRSSWPLGRGRAVGNGIMYSSEQRGGNLLLRIEAVELGDVPKGSTVEIALQHANVKQTFTHQILAPITPLGTDVYFDWDPRFHIEMEMVIRRKAKWVLKKPEKVFLSTLVDTNFEGTCFDKRYLTVQLSRFDKQHRQQE